MAKINSISDELVDKRDLFLKNIDSDMHYILNQKSDSISFKWLDEIEESCPFIDNIIRRPKVTLIKDEVVVEAGRAKKITVDSVKDLAKHSNYITDVDDKNIKLSKILDIRSEETYNIYENRFLYTLVYDLDKFVHRKEEQLKEYELCLEKSLEYKSETNVKGEKIKIEMTVSTFSGSDDNSKLTPIIEKQKTRIKRVREYITSWLRSEIIKELDKAHVTFINPPVKPTNIILKNPNFQVAVKLWDSLRKYDAEDGISKVAMENDGTKVLLSYMDDAFLTSYFVADSVSKKKREEKKKICEYSIILLSELVYKTMTLLKANDIDMTTDNLLTLLSKIVDKEENNRLIGADDIKKKFQAEIEEFLEMAKKSL